MRSRCYNLKDTRYADWGGRGIKVCDRWRESFTSFLADMGEKPAKHTLDRRDNNGDYEPSNCRWAVAKTQNRNKRNNRQVCFRGETLSVAEWADRTGLSSRLIVDRLNAGWDAERTLTATPEPAPRDEDGRFTTG